MSEAPSLRVSKKPLTQVPELTRSHDQGAKGQRFLRQLLEFPSTISSPTISTRSGQCNMVPCIMYNGVATATVHASIIYPRGVCYEFCKLT